MSACLLVAGLPPGWAQPSDAAPVPAQAVSAAGPAPGDVLRAIAEAAKLPGFIEGYITSIRVVPPAPPPTAEGDGPPPEPVFAQDEGSLIQRKVVTICKMAFRCRPGGYLVDLREFQVTRDGPTRQREPEICWREGTEGEFRFMPWPLSESGSPGFVGESGFTALGALEDALQVDVGGGEGHARYWLRRKTEAASLRVRDGVMRQGLSCIEIAYKRTEPVHQEVVEWVCPARGYRCVERVQRSHARNGHTKYMHMVVEAFAEAMDGFWLPRVASLTTTHVAPDGTVTVSHELTTCSGVRPVDAEEAAVTPLLPNGTTLPSVGETKVVGDNTRELVTQLAAGQLPPPLPVPDLEGLWP